MTTTRRFPVLVATDGSSHARAAVAVATVFPWPRTSSGHGVIARGVPVVADWPPSVWEALEETYRREARRTERQLRERWPGAEVTVVGDVPVTGILRRVKALGARALVVGSRGQGALSRLVLGSTSRGVARHAPCAVLVVRSRPRSVARLVLGHDGSPQARQAVELVARLTPPRGAHVTLVGAVEPVRAPSMGLMPGRIRALVAAEVDAAERERATEARRRLELAAAGLRRAGWRTDVLVRTGAPLDELLDAVRLARADALVIGARGTGGMERLLLGSVAEGALTRSPVPVLIAR